MEKVKCMVSDVAVDYSPSVDTAEIIVIQSGKVIGLIREEAQQGIKTIRMTFTRPTEAAIFTPLQGQGIEFFQNESEL
jgi:hypothetical protein